MWTLVVRKFRPVRADSRDTRVVRAKFGSWPTPAGRLVEIHIDGVAAIWVSAEGQFLSLRITGPGQLPTLNPAPNKTQKQWS